MKNIALVIFLILASCSSAVVIPPSADQKNAERQIEKAKKAFSRGDADKAFGYIEDSIKISTAFNLPHSRVHALLLKSKMCLEMRKLDKAGAVLKEARKIAENDAVELAPYIILSEAALAWEQGDKKTPSGMLDKIEKMPAELEPAVLNFKSRIMSFHGNMKDALEHAEKALKKADDTGNFYEKSAALKNIAVSYTAAGRHEDAVERVKEALELDRKLGDIKAILWDLETLGNLYTRTGKKEKAFYYHMHVIEMSDNLSDAARKLYFLDNSVEFSK